VAHLRFGLSCGALAVSFHEGNFKSPTVDGSENLKRTTWDDFLETCRCMYWDRLPRLKWKGRISEPPVPIGSMYGIFTYIWLICMVNVGKYTIHGSYGVCHDVQ